MPSADKLVCSQALQRDVPTTEKKYVVGKPSAKPMLHTNDCRKILTSRKIKKTTFTSASEFHHMIWYKMKVFLFDHFL